jgi:hypothetical protein
VRTANFGLMADPFPQLSQEKINEIQRASSRTRKFDEANHVRRAQMITQRFPAH